MPTSAYCPQCSQPTSGYGYQAASAYIGSPVQAQAPFSVVGYPYVPHNPTLPELEACESRIRSVKNRQAAHPRYSMCRSSDSGKSGWAATGSTAQPGGNESEKLPHHGGSYVYGPTAVDLQSSEEEEESDGPDTPFSSREFLWQEWVAGAPDVQGTRAYPNQRRVFDPYKHSPAPTAGQDYLSLTDEPDLLEATGTDSGSGTDSALDSLASIAAHNKINKIVYQLNSLVLDFKFPIGLEFEEPTGAEGWLPKLAHTSASRVIREHDHRLEKLLEELDEIRSLGHASVKRARKLAIDRLIKELEALKEKQAMAWYNQQYERTQHMQNVMRIQ